jgi:hypothetical protein
MVCCEEFEGNSKKWKGGFILRGDFLNFLWIRISHGFLHVTDLGRMTCLVTVMADSLIKRALGTCVSTGTTSVAGWA